MKRVKELCEWDFPDIVEEVDGYNIKSIPELSRKNMNVLIKAHNELLTLVNKLADDYGVVFDDE